MELMARTKEKAANAVIFT